MSVMLAEGLDKQPIKHIILQLHNLKLNCVRLTWATYMFTRYSNNTVQQTLDSLGLANTKAGITEHNHDVLTMTHPQAYVYVVDQLAAQNIMIISDNHISEPKWCCAPDDGNAFFGDTSFDPKEWLQGLSMAAQLLKDKPNVVVMSLRNELRGPLQNTNSWYGNMTQGAQTVHQGNPNVVVLISGFYNDNDLSFLKDKPLNLTFKDKLAYEVHAYTVSGEPKNWSNQSANYLCGKVNNELNSHAGFLTTSSNPAPLLMTEYGIPLSPNRTEPDERWLTCVLAYLAVNDLGWGWWGLQGSYYLREGNVNPGESYGLVDFQWKKPSYPEFPNRFQLVLKTLQDPSSKEAMSSIFYHPQTGQCMKSRKLGDQVEVNECKRVSGWSLNGTQIKFQSRRKVKCLKANGDGNPVLLTKDCSNTNQTSWKPITESGMHWATVDAQGNQLCLQKDANSSTILTAKCICADSNSSCMDNPQSQWFQFVSSNVK
ncbi:glycosyl hydrolase 5 family protein-like isoform X1 [Prosopis cineraria]|uniref:glycosyl hydrolase 5 family protein-like isoform X1 n=1 Tax=Prosopis cineraria TaxID=364024 RepID=UPI00240FA914|nr:glycosyl hydrolase 5 family protein-like isoform X1 [Prosopis cineraria]